MIPSREEQIIQVHAAFIRQVVELGQNSDNAAELGQVLDSAQQNGWGTLVSAVRKMLAGQRELSALGQLDEEDRAIAGAIMRGLQDPNTLPQAGAQGDAKVAAPGLAHMIHAAATGDAQALTLVANMAEQMNKAGGDLARLAGVIRPLINGERDPDRLCKGMDTRSEQLVADILSELGKLSAH